MGLPTWISQAASEFSDIKETDIQLVISSLRDKRKVRIRNSKAKFPDHLICLVTSIDLLNRWNIYNAPILKHKYHNYVGLKLYGWIQKLLTAINRTQAKFCRLGGAQRNPTFSTIVIILANI